MKKPLFTGACTALVTPFRNGKINFEMVRKLTDRQMSAGIYALVLCGTTGESPTLSDSEKLELFRFVKEYTGSDCTVIAGTGSNDTRHVLELSRCAEEAGADGLLVVSPYYNKSTPEGLYEHYRAVASSVHIPVILYNVPSRTAQDIPAEVYKELSDISNIAGVKEASTDIKKILKTRMLCGNDFAVWSGNDDMIVPAMSLGSLGVISVLSNLYPEETQIMAQAALAGDFDTAAALQIRLCPVIELLFSQVNPIPIKQAMIEIGFDCGECRLPLTAPSEKLKLQLKQMLS